MLGRGSHISHWRLDSAAAAAAASETHGTRRLMEPWSKKLRPTDSDRGSGDDDGGKAHHLERRSLIHHGFVTVI